MNAAGFDSCVMDSGQLMRPTHGRHLLHQPVSCGTLSKKVKDSMKFAHKKINCVPGLLPGDVPKWNTHSARRGGAKRALDVSDESGVEPIQVEFHFGWDEMANAKDHTMMFMYCGDSEREKRALLTKFF